MRYEIRLQGHLGDEWADSFGGSTLIREGDSVTLLICPVSDQAELFGILRKVRDLGIPLVSVDRVSDC
jgi:hypothetical protein